MNNSTAPIATVEHSSSAPAKRRRNHSYPKMYLPSRIYEALPAAYISVGTLLVLGAAYIGIGDGLMVGYMAVGMSCIFAGLTVSSIRHRERSKSQIALA